MNMLAKYINEIGIITSMLYSINPNTHIEIKIINQTQKADARKMNRSTSLLMKKEIQNTKPMILIF